jgi:NADPH-dependent 2,4-dienoyl-CoA reductase/sulfur reductase-like enzyme
MPTSEITHFDYLIVGGGMVANFAAEGIRERDQLGTIGILSEDVDSPYARPALSKKLWTDPSFSLEDAWFDTAEATHADLHLETRVAAIDRAAHLVTTDDGERFAYRNLLIATGGRPTHIDLPADDRVIWFRSMRDYKRLRDLSKQHGHIAVIGGGYIGTELAAALIAQGCTVTLITPDEILGGSILPTDLAEAFDDRYVASGVTVLRGARVEKGTADATGIRLTLDDGSQLTADVVVSGLGITPNVELAEAAGLATADGVLVDENLVTSDPDIYAAGDVAEYPDVLLGRRRIEHVDNATVMGHTAGHNMAGEPHAYDHTPYYYSVIFGTRYEAVGTLDASLDTVEDWSVPLESGVVYYLKHDRVAGVLLWNVEGRLDEARKVIAESGVLTRDDLVGLIRP